MNLTYNETLKLKGKKLINVNPTSGEFGKTFTVTSSTKNNVVLDNGIKIKTVLFVEIIQNNYKLCKD